MLRTIILLSCLLSINALASNDKNINSDDTQYEAPRLAGDSLAIKPLVKSVSQQTVSLSDMFKNGNFKGLIRYSAQHRDTNYRSRESSAITNSVQQYSAIGGYLGYETAKFNNISLGATFYTAQKIGNNPDDRLGLGGLNEDGGTANSYAVLGEAYIKYRTEEHYLHYGRREMPDYRFVSLSNIRFSPYTHEGTTYENTMYDGLKLNLGYINSQKARNAEDFQDMVRSARVNESSIRGSYNPSNYTSGSYSGANKSMAMIGLALNKNGLSMEVWDYYVSDFVNTLYLYGDYNFKISKEFTLTTAAQYAKQQDVGNHVAGNIDTSFYGLKIQGAFKNGITLFGAYNNVAYNEKSYDGGTIFVRWGTPQMFNSFQVQDSEIAGTKSIGVGAQFELGRLGLIDNTVIRFRYANYDMPDSVNDRDAAQDRSEATFDFRYSFTKNDGFGIFTEMKGLSIQFRIAYDDFKTDYDYAAYIAKHGVSFSKVTDDFVDTRLYIDYMF
ncbi:putative outer membrane porin [Sulfurimonas gotlandica GD1]|uniref:Putative outer membrane porin n=1 Tax=Sulfurimonas gotlandica (strain DSM 19862 / JCM 16533 / GD1) TaxID=929558 RepID=B6BJM0_SULGG|nr:OprD family outer membrane porin [Sulfurimonas gotlandica]EDZ62769.1 outer membrane porin, OprD family [Sulfurimonas gotlandica GD1]EHP31265.1 putative outer membrane porin [Sulfurimonas gotlandica GD1]